MMLLRPDVDYGLWLHARGERPGGSRFGEVRRVVGSSLRLQPGSSEISITPATNTRGRTVVGGTRLRARHTSPLAHASARPLLARRGTLCAGSHPLLPKWGGVVCPPPCRMPITQLARGRARQGVRRALSST